MTQRATLILKDRNGKNLAKIKVAIKNGDPLHLKNPPQGAYPHYPMYEVVAANGITEILEHRKPEPMFYVSDDPAVRKELLEKVKMK